ncbi:hypothetical protein D6D02_10207 [Aureobasidium pullulans]|nr:hypothetical protein D6D18_09773 [Aureobasidium pullulans]THX94043.1 hypothetical protein D6D02_10207 [Aureobasidium pullulans]THZ18538.1 hypothetical protein D6C89_08225 [Aureobasidium pullulans]
MLVEVSRDFVLWLPRGTCGRTHSSAESGRTRCRQPTMTMRGRKINLSCRQVGSRRRTMARCCGCSMCFLLLTCFFLSLVFQVCEVGMIGKERRAQEAAVRDSRTWCIWCRVTNGRFRRTEIWRRRRRTERRWTQETAGSLS